MSGFMGWFLAFVVVLAIFNAEKLPDLKQMLEEKFKNSVEAAKEGSKLAKTKLQQVRSDMENKKSTAAIQPENEENTPEEIEESLKFMGNFINQGDEKTAKNKEKKTTETVWQDSYAEEDKLVLKEPTTPETANNTEYTDDTDVAPIVLDGYVAEETKKSSDDNDAENNDQVLTENSAKSGEQAEEQDPLSAAFTDAAESQNKEKNS